MEYLSVEYEVLTINDIDFIYTNAYTIFVGLL